MRYLRSTLIAVVLLCLIALVACTSDGTTTVDDPSTDVPDTGAPATPSETVAWLDTELTDVVTGEMYSLSDFKGTPVLLHSFAVW